MLLAQQRIYGIPDLKNYGPKDHNSGSQTWGAVQDVKGRMYFANRAGVITFDGHYWQTIELSNRNTARSIAMDDQGTIYVGGIAEVGYLATDSLGGLKYVSLLDKISEESRPVLKDSWFTAVTDEGIFFVGLYDVFKYQEGAFTHYVMENEKGGPINRAWEVDGKLYLLRPDSGLWTIDGEGLHLVPDGEKVANPNSTASGLIPWENNKLLFNSYTGETWAFSETGARKEEDPSFAGMRQG